MKNNLMSLVKNKKLYVISPHLDDAILSLGMLLFNLKRNLNITVINVFTGAHSGPYTFSAKKYLKMTGCKNAEELSEIRRNEDKSALSKINAKVIDLRFQDALFRKNKTRNFFGKFLPELDHIYPTYGAHVLKGVSAKDFAILDVEDRLKRLVGKDSIVFAPYGIGNHVDHVILRYVCEKLFKNLILYSDFPYNVKLNNYGKSLKGYTKIVTNPDYKVKSELVNEYKSQVSGLFKNGVMLRHLEEFFVKKNLYE